MGAATTTIEELENMGKLASAKSASSGRAEKSGEGFTEDVAGRYS